MNPSSSSAAPDITQSATDPTAYARSMFAHTRAQYLAQVQAHANEANADPTADSVAAATAVAGQPSSASSSSTPAQMPANQRQPKRDPGANTSVSAIAHLSREESTASEGAE